MKIVDKRMKSCAFGELKCGQTFSYEGDIFMKIECTYSNTDGYYENVVLMRDGTLRFLEEGICVVPVDAELTIS